MPKAAEAKPVEAKEEPSTEAAAEPVEETPAVPVETPAETEPVATEPTEGKLLLHVVAHTIVSQWDFKLDTSFNPCSH